MRISKGGGKYEILKLKISEESHRELYVAYQESKLKIINHLGRHGNYLNLSIHAKKLMPLVADFIALASLLDLEKD